MRGYMREKLLLVNPSTFLSSRENPARDGKLADQSGEEIFRAASGAEHRGYNAKFIDTQLQHVRVAQGPQDNFLIEVRRTQIQIGKA